MYQIIIHLAKTITFIKCHIISACHINIRVQSSILTLTPSARSITSSYLELISLIHYVGYPINFNWTHEWHVLCLGICLSKHCVCKFRLPNCAVIWFYTSMRLTSQAYIWHLAMLTGCSYFNGKYNFDLA